MNMGLVEISVTPRALRMPGAILVTFFATEPALSFEGVGLLTFSPVWGDQKL
jgi:hypothetical protein